MFKSFILLLGFGTSVYGAVLQPGGNFTQGPYTLYNYISTSTGLTDHSVSTVLSTTSSTPLESTTEGLSEEFDASTSSVYYHYSTSTGKMVPSSPTVSWAPATTSLSIQAPPNFVEHLSVPSSTLQNSITTRRLVPSVVSNSHPATITKPIVVDPFHGVKENNGMEYMQGKLTTFTSDGTKYVLEVFPTYTITLTTESGENTYTYNTYSVFTKVRVSKHISYDDSIDNTYTETSTLSTYYGGYWTSVTTTSAVVTTYEPLVYRLESKVMSALASWQSVISVSEEYLSTVKLGPIKTDPGLYLTTVEVTERHDVSLDGVAIYYTVAVPKLVTFTLAAYTDYYTDTYYSTRSIEDKRFSRWVSTIITVIDGRTETAYVEPILTTRPNGQPETVPFTFWYRGGFGIIATPLGFPTQQLTSATMTESSTFITSAVPVQSVTDVPLTSSTTSTTSNTPSMSTASTTPSTSSMSSMSIPSTMSTPFTMSTTSSISTPSTVTTPSTSSTTSTPSTTPSMSTTSTTSTTSSASSTSSTSSQGVSVMRMGTSNPVPYIPEEDTTSVTSGTSTTSGGATYVSSSMRRQSKVIVSSNSDIVGTKISSPVPSSSSIFTGFSSTSHSFGDAVSSSSAAAEGDRVSVDTLNSQDITNSATSTAGGHESRTILSIIMRSGNKIVTRTSVVSETSTSTPGTVTGGEGMISLAQSPPSSTDYMGLLTHFTGGAAQVSGGALKAVGGLLAVLLMLGI